MTFLSFIVLAAFTIEPASNICVGAAPLVVTIEQEKCNVVEDAVAKRDSVIETSIRIESKNRYRLHRESPASATQYPEEWEMRRVALEFPGAFTGTVDIAIVEEPADGGAGGEWVFRLRPPESREPLELVLQPGSYKISADADGFSPASAELRDTVSTTLVMTPLFRIDGRVLGGDAPLHASIEDESGRVLATTDENGTFRLRLRADGWPERLLVVAGGFGAQTLDLPPSAMHLDVGEVRLVKGGRIRLMIAEELQGQIRVIEVHAFSNPRRPVLSRRLVGGADDDGDSLTIESLEPGPYLIICMGDQPLERIGRVVEVKAHEDTELLLSSNASSVVLKGRVGTEPLPHARIELESIDGHWKTNVVLDEEGQAEATVWQRGQVAYFLDSPATGAYGGVASLERDEVVFEIPDTRLSGRVVDAETGRGLREVTVTLQGPRLGRMAKSGPDGEFQFVGIATGEYLLRAGGSDGLSAVARRLYFDSENDANDIILALDRQSEVIISLSDHFGHPAPAAVVVELQGPTLSGFHQTDSSGRVRVPASNAARDLLIVAPQGHLFVVPLSPSELNASITIPPATGAVSLAMVAKDDRRPLEGIAVVMRVNGVLVPPELMHVLHERIGVRLRSAVDGMVRIPRAVAGTYEFWPIRSQQDAESVMANRLGAPPVVVVVTHGESRAALHFSEPRETKDAP
jgi:hypothetical protein